MKKILLKLNIAVILVVVLFAHVSFANVQIDGSIGEAVGQSTQVSGYIRAQKIKVNATGTYRIKCADGNNQSIRIVSGNDSSIKTEIDRDGTIIATLTADIEYKVEHDYTANIIVTAVELDEEGNPILEDGEENEQLANLQDDAEKATRCRGDYHKSILGNGRCVFKCNKRNIRVRLND